MRETIEFQKLFRNFAVRKQSKNMHQNYIKYNAKTPPKYLQSSTGKERDSETGFSYFGARYYDSDILTGWLSVDPMADKYPNLSPYAYCAWNPIRLVDPDGEKIINAYEEYKNNHQKIQDLKNKKEQAKTRQERREIQWQINNAESNYDKYLKVEKNVG